MNYIVVRVISILITSYITRVGVPLSMSFGTAWTALLVAISLAIINHTIKPLFLLISIPINIATLGLFSFVFNGFMILLADKMVAEFSIPSLIMAIYFAIVLSVVNWVLHIFE